jgi:hypothetical protein
MGWVFATYFVASGAYLSSAGGQFGLCEDGPSTGIERWLESLVNAWFLIIDSEKYRQKYRLFSK